MNKQRGEAEIQLAGKTYVLRPTFEVLCNIESALGKGILEVVTKGLNREISTREMAVIVHTAIVEDAPDFEAVGEALVSMGLTDAIGPISEFLKNALEGGSKNAPAAKD